MLAAQHVLSCEATASRQNLWYTDNSAFGVGVMLVAVVEAVAVAVVVLGAFLIDDL